MATLQVPPPEVEHHLAKKPLSETTAITPLELLQIAVSQDANIERLQALMELQFKWEANQARKEFVAALNKFKSNPPEILKSQSANTGSYSYNYATLDSVCRAVIQGLSKVGISHRWTMQQAAGSIRVTCILTHDAGHSEETSLEGAPDQSGVKNSIQAVGSTVTYLQRYTLLAATGLAASGTDTDGKVGQANSLPQDRISANCQKIAAAKTRESLFEVYKFAYIEASEANDQKAMAAYIAAKDARKRELQ